MKTWEELPHSIKSFYRSLIWAESKEEVETCNSILAMLENVFEAGRKRGRDEMGCNYLKYDHEIKVPNFDQYVKNIKI